MSQQRAKIDLREPNLFAATNIVYNPNFGARLIDPSLEGSLTMNQPIRTSGIHSIFVDGQDLLELHKDPLSLVRFILVDVDLGMEYWWDGTAWSISDGSFGQANVVDGSDVAVEEMELPLLYFFDSGPRNVAIKLVVDALPAVEGTVVIERLEVAYEADEDVSEGVSLCRVFGFVTGASGEAIEGVTVTAVLDVHPQAILRADGRIIYGIVEEATTDAQGLFSLNLIPSGSFEGEFAGSRYRIQFLTNNGGLRRHNLAKENVTILVPTALEVDISTLI